MGAATPAAAPRAFAPLFLSAPATLFFIGLVLLPLALTIILSFNSYDYTAGIQNDFSLANYLTVLQDEYYLSTFWRTLRLALLTTVIAVLIGVPEAYILSNMRKPWRSIFLLVIIGPLLVSVVVRTFGWSMLLGKNGLVNGALAAVGLEPVQLLYTEAAIVIGLVHIMLPFMVIPVWTVLQKLDPTVEAAALTLGASRFTALRRIVFPQAALGILSGSLIVFALSASSFAIPGLLGGRRLKMAATLVYDEFLIELNWPLGATIAIIVLVANLVIMLAYNRLIEQQAKRKLG
ncbi:MULTISPECIES: ABC transporter permease [Ensifer]|uniref:ABC transporter permease subunit n=1 Tax=Ensifer canadensis TaxID=555315 RepID=A0AAW4FNR9_9HYPH|nr:MULTISPECIES: ABC transporter permease [Ensifer]MDP9634680.1 putative spermidine/putrescine transport system permease protein [Ensifer adhaerens]KQU90382.1 ABC transporter permease [Ensifer sp. Root31]KQW50560.1 ABC transporter permease [Ensifer sp. Root1252]KQW67141.1 ABC transporter permease [Ensifer sp. Root127]KQY63328.1 ABC transporter permease [Ensifer sp. Root142]